MPDPAPMLTYARPPAARWRRWVVALLIAGIGVGLTVWLRPIAQRKYVAWQQKRQFAAAKRRFERAFDAAWQLPGEALWCWNGNEDQHTIARELAVAYLGGTMPIQLVPLIRRGETDGQKWISIVHYGRDGFHSRCVARDGWPRFISSGFDHFPRSMTSVGYTHPFDVKTLLGVTTLDNDGKSLIADVESVDGGVNRIQWTWQPQSDVYTAKPLTGWYDGNFAWTPDPPGLRLVEAQSARAALPVIDATSKIAFTTDNGIAIVGSKTAGIFDLQTRRFRSEHPTPHPGWQPEYVIFSDDATRAAIRGRSVMDLVSGNFGAEAPSDGGGDIPAVDSPQMLFPMRWSGRRLRRVNWDLLILEQLADVPPGLCALTPRVIACVEGRVLSILQRDSRTVLASYTVGGSDRSYYISVTSISPDSRWVLASTQDGLILLDISTGKPAWKLPIDQVRAGALVRWSTDGRFGAVSTGRNVYFFNTNEPYWLARGRQKDDSGTTFGDVAIEPDGRLAAVTNSIFTRSAAIHYWPSVTAATQSAAMAPMNLSTTRPATKIDQE